MRPQLPVRAAVANAAVGMLAATTYLSAGSPAAADSDTQGAPVTVSIHDASLDYGQALVASGRIASTQAGQGVALQARDAGTTAFRTVRTGTTTKGANVVSVNDLPSQPRSVRWSITDSN